MSGRFKFIHSPFGTPVYEPVIERINGDVREMQRKLMSDDSKLLLKAMPVESLVLLKAQIIDELILRESEN